MSMRRELEEERNGRDSPKEYTMEDLRRDSMKSLRSSSRLAMMENELRADSTPSRFSRENVINGFKGLSQGSVIYPDDRYSSHFLSLSVWMHSFSLYCFSLSNKSSIGLWWKKFLIKKIEFES
ncbi:hypothetical protein HAX54_052049 [Datura stramonium]|uniref:Uncharacterized protein n=1 Tax=Datura stramonium TaxID=4076 RepID=A0ABS8WN61_DATST|nr:hypothetical protein [Datura stramonium]